MTGRFGLRLQRTLVPDSSHWKISNAYRFSRLMVAAKGCAFLHSTSPPIMHRDLKSPNVLLADTSSDADVIAKVCDFGVSLSTAYHTAGRRVDCPGTLPAAKLALAPNIHLPSVQPVWLAPEVMANKIYTVKADVYSLGVILWELLTRQPFFGEIRFMSQLEDMVIGLERLCYQG